MRYSKETYDLNGISGRILENPSLSAIEEIWLPLSKYSTHIFFDWLWIGSWLDIVQGKVDIDLFVINDGDEVIAAVFLLYDIEKRHICIKSKQIFLNESRHKDLDMTIEYNGILVKPGQEEAAYKIFCQFLKNNHNWDEIVLNAFNNDCYQLINKNLNYIEYVDENLGSQQANLSSLNVTEKDKLKQQLLSKNKRSQINRSTRLYEQQYGPIEFSIAKDIKQATNYFQQLANLHTKYWQAKGEPGAFANPHWVAFHEKIIANGFNEKKVQLVEIKSGDCILGYLYNLVNEKTVFNIQCGFQYLDDNRFKPGFLSHWLMIEYCWENNFAIYDFLAGGEEYKNSFSNSSTDMVWAKIYQPKLIFRVENFLRKLKRNTQMKLSAR